MFEETKKTKRKIIKRETTPHQEKRNTSREMMSEKENKMERVNKKKYVRRKQKIKKEK